ncbi:MAG: hypothetical protein Q8O82_06715 [Pseudorhodobacter sp.]|nr:hypothetical protein [Pseudorhodobacter sp.]
MSATLLIPALLLAAALDEQRAVAALAAPGSAGREMLVRQVWGNLAMGQDPVRVRDPQQAGHHAGRLHAAAA